MGSIVYEKQIVTESRSEAKIDLSLFRKHSTGRTAKGIVLGYLKKLRNKVPLEYLKVLENLYKEIANLEISEEFRAKQWRGKSGVKYMTSPEKVIAIRHRRLEPGGEPKEIPMELTKNEINHVIWAINSLNLGDWMETSDIAEKVYGKPWQLIFSNRPEHTHLVEILNYLEYRGWTEYSRSGKTRVLGKLEEQRTLTSTLQGESPS